MLLWACRRWEQALLGPYRLYNWGLREKRASEDEKRYVAEKQRADEALS